MTVNSYLTGNKVYNGGTSAATRGTVNPTGYVNRELNKPSTSRSTLASQALKRVKNNATSNKTKTPAPKKTTVTPKPPIPVVPKAPVAATSTGKVVPNTPKLPFDYELETQRIANEKSLNDTLAQLQSSDTQNEIDHYSKTRDEEYQRKDTLGRVLNNAGARGMVFSSGYAGQVSDTQRVFDNMLSAIENDYTSQKNANQSARTSAQSNYSTSLTALQQEAARRAAANAGKAAPLDPNYKPPAKKKAPPAQKPMPYSQKSTPKKKPAPKPAPKHKTPTHHKKKGRR